MTGQTFEMNFENQFLEHNQIKLFTFPSEAQLKQIEVTDVQISQVLESKNLIDSILEPMTYDRSVLRVLNKCIHASSVLTRDSRPVPLMTMSTSHLMKMMQARFCKKNKSQTRLKTHSSWTEFIDGRNLPFITKRTNKSTSNTKDLEHFSNPLIQNECLHRTASVPSLVVIGGQLVRFVERFFWVPTQDFDLCESVQICRILQIFADMCRSAEFLQIFADICRFEKTTDVLRNTIKTHSDVKRAIKMFKTGEKSHLCQNDETFFCSNLDRSVEITDLYRAKQWPINYNNVFQTSSRYWKYSNKLCCGNIITTTLYQHIDQPRRLPHVKFYLPKQSQYGKRASQSSTTTSAGKFKWNG